VSRAASRRVARRLAVSVLLVLGIVTLVFFVARLLPGDPATLFVGPDIDPEHSLRLREQLGLDRPLVLQYLHWLGSFLHADFGISFTARRPVAELLRAALPNTLRLMGLALALRFGLGLALGTVAALRHHRGRDDRGIVVGALLLYSVPGFWLAVMLQLLFAYTLRWLPPESMQGLDHASLGALGRLADDLRHLVLPVTVLTLGGLASTTRYVRASLLEVLSRDYVRAARARGLDERRVVLRHALRSALAPFLVQLGLALPGLVGGAIVVEQIFSWPGMGRLALHAVASRDYPVLLATTFLSAVLVVLGNLAADLACAALDPRRRGA
jgi:peptide/nickel transport system permease protein